MTLGNLLIFSAVAVVLSVAGHWFVRRYWWAVLVSVSAASLANVIHEGFLHGFQIRPADVAFWIPMELFYGMLFALPVAALTGIPFYVIRRRHSKPV